jgi:PAS domain S-box-containing protein
MDMKRSNLDDQKHQELTKKVTNNIPAMLAYWDKNEICRLANTAYLQWFGKTPEEMVDKMSMRELLGPLYKKNLPHIKRVLTGETQIFEREMKVPSGEVRYSLATYTPDIVNNEVLGFIAHVADITNIKKVELSHSQLEEKFKNLLQSTPDALVVVDESGYIQVINQQLENVFGYSKQEIIGRSVEILLPERFKAQHESHMHSYFRSPESRRMGGGAQLYARRKNGEEFPVEITLSSIETKVGLQIAASIRDTSERIISEAKLKELSDRLKLTTQYSLIGIWDLDVAMNVLTWDTIMFQLYGVKKENFSGAYDAWLAGLHPEDRVQAEKDFQMALSGEKEFDTEFRVVWPDKTVHFIKARAMVQRDQAGNALRVLGTNWDITIQKLAEIEIKQSNQRNRIFIEQAPRAMAMFDKNMCYMAASQQWINDYKLSEKQIIGCSHYEIFPEIGEDWKQIHRECLEGAVNQCDEAPFERKDGSLQWITWDVRPWYISKGIIGGLIMYTADITHLKQKDQEKRRIEEILDKTSEVARTGTWEVYPKLGKVSWSRITKEIHEVEVAYKPDLATAINFFKPGESQTIIERVVTEAIEKGTPYDVEVELITAKGNIVWTRAIGQAEFENGECKRLYGVFQDIDRIKRSEQLLNKANQELKAILNSEQVSIIGTDTSGIITHFNHGAEAMLQYSSSEMVGKKTLAVFHLEEEIMQRSGEMFEIYGCKFTGFNVFVELARQGKHETRQWTYLRKDQSTIKVLLTTTALRDEKNEITGFLGIAIDISEQVESRRKLIEAKEQLEILSERLTAQNVQLANFAHITSHNLRSPVGNLNSLLYFYKTAESEEERIMLFEKFEIVINHLSSTLNSLVEALKIQQDANKEFEVIAFADVLEKTNEIISAQIMETGAKIKSDFSKAPQIEYNRSYLESIFLNLLTNAIKYRDPTRPIEIDIKTDILNERILFTIKDNGLGIDLARHGHKLFGLHKTFHRHPEAKGVGLYLTKTQIETMGGTISAQSEVGKGTIFTIKF